MSSSKVLTTHLSYLKASNIFKPQTFRSPSFSPRFAASHLPGLHLQKSRDRIDQVGIATGQSGDGPQMFHGIFQGPTGLATHPNQDGGRAAVFALGNMGMTQPGFFGRFFRDMEAAYFVVYPLEAPSFS